MAVGEFQQVKTILLTQGKVALVDDEDYPALARWTWFAAMRAGKWYAQRSVRITWPSLNRRKVVVVCTVYMHLEIMGCKDGLMLDHANGDGLDNRRKNLRWATSRQNALNRRLESRGRAGRRNVEPLPNGKFRARISVEGKRKNLGTYPTAAAAAAAYDTAARTFYGAFGVFNFPDRAGETGAF